MLRFVGSWCFQNNSRNLGKQRSYSTGPTLEQEKEWKEWINQTIKMKVTAMDANAKTESFLWLSLHTKLVSRKFRFLMSKQTEEDFWFVFGSYEADVWRHHTYGTYSMCTWHNNNIMTRWLILVEARFWFDSRTLKYRIRGGSENPHNLSSYLLFWGCLLELELVERKRN